MTDKSLDHKATTDSTYTAVNSTKQAEQERRDGRDGLGQRALSAVKTASENIHVPYLPPLHKPGWLVSYVKGPYDGQWLEKLLGDLVAGITVLMTLIPQGLAYGSLAQLPPVNGLYASIVPSATYAAFGTCSHLALGPVAVVSLLTARVFANLGVDTEDYGPAVLDTAAQAALCSGLITVAMGVLNMGIFIRWISHPVMSGFTTAIAFLIGMSQLKGAFGFPKGIVPQVGGETGVHYNYEQMEWYAHNFNSRYTYTAEDGSTEELSVRNHFAYEICFSIYVPLILISQFKNNYKFSAEFKKTWKFKAFNFFVSNLPLLALVVAAKVSYDIIKGRPDDPYAQTLSIVGEIAKGVDIFRIPQFRHSMGTMLIEVLPLTLIGFMESYGVGRKTAVLSKELHMLDASQELYATGFANMLGSVSSAFPVVGSYSRTSLAFTSGGRTQLTQVVTVLANVIVLTSLTSLFYYIPSAALSAVIFAAVTNLICVSDFTEAWKHSKVDFFTMVITFGATFILEPGIGLAVGVGLSLLVLLYNIVYSPYSSPSYTPVEDADDSEFVKNDPFDPLCEACEHSTKDKDIEAAALGDDEDACEKETGLLKAKLLRVNNDLVFLTAPRIKDKIMELVNGANRTRLQVLLVDFSDVKFVDITGLIAMKEAVDGARIKHLKFVILNIRDGIYERFKSFHIESDRVLRGKIDQASMSSPILSSMVNSLPHDGYFTGLTDDEDEMSSDTDADADVQTYTDTDNKAQISRENSDQNDDNVELGILGNGEGVADTCMRDLRDAMISSPSINEEKDDRL